MAEERLPLADLDAGSAVAQAIAQGVVSGAVALPRLSPRPSARDRIEALERALADGHGQDLRAVAWHGRTSHQRIVWQSAEFWSATRDTEGVEAILARGMSGEETDLGGGNTLSRILLEGLAINRPSYLLTVCPNWRLRPRAPGVRFRKLSDMAVPETTQDAPLMVCADDLAAASGSLRTIQETLVELTGGRAAGPPADGLWSAVDVAATGTLLGAISALLDLPAAARLVGVPGNPSTAIERMNGQCLEVMDAYHELLSANAGRHERVIGYGLVSHALDAKHLAAAIVYGLGLYHTRYRLVDDDTASDALAALLDGAAAASIGAHAGELMRVRLQQVMRLVVDRRRELGISAERIGRALDSGTTSR